MSLIKRNILANIAGNFWAALMSILFIPVYIYFMGIEAYGLVGVFVILQTVSTLLDMGIGATLNREMARRSVYAYKTQDMRDLLRTLETIYWAIGLVIVITIFLTAPYISHKWVHGKQISPVLIERAILIMGAAVALQAVSGFYAGGLLGLQKQVLLNGVSIFISTLRGVGAIMVLWLISPTIQAFFIWQVIVSLAQVSILAFSLWHGIPGSNLRAVFRPDLLKEVWHFAAGMSGILIMGVILSQIDKIVLTKLVTLDIFGYYVLGSTVAMGLYRLIDPASAAIYPRFTQLVAMGDQNKLVTAYHLSSQLMSVLILPCAAIVAFFPREVLFLWKQSSVTIEHTYVFLSILISGTALYGLMSIPRMLQLAFGWTKLIFYMSLTAIVVLIPLMFYLVSFYGAVGAAFAWVILNSFYLLVGIRVMHKHLLKNEELHWWINDVGKPLISVILISLIGKFFVNSSLPYFRMFISLSLLFLLSASVSIAACSQLRGRILGKLKFERSAA